MITDSETFRPVTVNLDTTSSFTDPVLLRETANARLYRMSKAGKHFIIKTTKDNSAMQLSILKREYEMSISFNHYHIAHHYTYETQTPIGPGIVMLLVNALAFEADWAKQFEQFRNSDDAFAGVNDTVTYMQSTERLYLEDNRAVGFIKPYAGDRYAFAAILPNEGISLDEYLAALDSTALVDLLDGAADATVIARLPKFSYDFDVDLAEALGEVGMTDAFDGGKADFSRLGHAVDGNIFIEKVLHRTHIALGEKGTKAAAASAIVMIPETVWIPPKDAKYVYLTRPFLYMIVDLDTNMPIFMGTVVDPS